MITLNLSLITVKHIIQASKTMSKDMTREFLCGVHLKRQGNDLVIIATDGYSAVRKILVDQCPDQLDDTGIIINKSAIEALKFEVKQAKNSKVQSIEFDLLPNYIIEREYPKTDIFFSTTADHYEIAFNAEVLQRAIDSLNCTNKNKIVRFKFTPDNLKPVVLTCTNDYTNDGNQIAIVMPCKF